MADEDPPAHHSGTTITANITAPTINPNTSAAMASVLECMTLQQSTYHIPHFDGKNPSLNEFLQDVLNGAVFISENSESAFIKAVLGKLKGPARESVRDKTFDRLDDLITHLKKRFASTKKYQWYFESIINLRMKQTETVSDYNDRLQGLISGAKHALGEKYGARYRRVNNDDEDNDIPVSEIMIKPIIDCALEAFIRGLPEEMSIFVDTRNPRNLSEAFEHALRAEERQRYSERSRSSSYHISRTGNIDRPRSPSPYSRQLEIGNEKRTRELIQDSRSEKVNAETNKSNLIQLTPEQLAQFYKSMWPQKSQSVPYQYPQAAKYPQQMQFQAPVQTPQVMSPYRGGNTPPRSLSPGPQTNLNSQQTRRSDAVASPILQRSKTVHFAENSVKSLESELGAKTPQ